MPLANEWLPYKTGVPHTDPMTGKSPAYSAPLHQGTMRPLSSASRTAYRRGHAGAARGFGTGLDVPAALATGPDLPRRLRRRPRSAPALLTCLMYLGLCAWPGRMVTGHAAPSSWPATVVQEGESRLSEPSCGPVSNMDTAACGMIAAWEPPLPHSPAAARCPVEAWETAAAPVPYGWRWYALRALVLTALLACGYGARLSARCVRTITRLDGVSARLLGHNRQLATAIADLRRQNHDLEAYAYLASHDLQEPLRKLVAFSHYLRQDLGPELPARAAQDLAWITDAATRMQALVQALLTLCHGEGRTLPRAWTSLDPCVDQAMAALARRIQETHACITRDTLPYVWGNATLLTQLYQNLLENALKFTARERPVIRVTATRHAGAWIFGVQDAGIGIDPASTERIFMPLTRLHSRTRYPGAGLGLAICRKVVAGHGGRLWVESSPGKGAHFRFTLAAGPSD